MHRTQGHKGVRRAAMAFLLALIMLTTVGCDSTPLEPVAGKTKLTSLPGDQAQP